MLSGFVGSAEKGPVQVRSRSGPEWRFRGRGGRIVEMEKPQPGVAGACLWMILNVTHYLFIFIAFVPSNAVLVLSGESFEHFQLIS